MEMLGHFVYPSSLLSFLGKIKGIDWQVSLVTFTRHFQTMFYIMEAIRKKTAYLNRC